MSVSVTFYTFSKDIASTKTPTGAGTSFSCLLREPTSVLNPTIVLQTSNPTAYNYAYISDFGGRYYYVNDWTSHKGQWIAQLKVDPLATYSATIKASSQYVRRSFSDKNEYIQDSYLPITSKITYQNATVKTGSNPFDDSSICYVVGILGTANISGTSIGGVTYYAFEDANFRSFLSNIMTSYAGWSGWNISDFEEATQRALLNPFQYIVSCHALPLTNNIGASYQVSSINFGPYSMAATAFAIPRNTIASRSISYTLPTHPQAAYGKYLNGAGYSEYTLFMGSFGSIGLDPSMMIDETEVDAVVKFDYISGDATLKILCPTTGYILEKVAHVAVDIPIAGAQYNAGKDIVDSLNMVGTVHSTLNPFTMVNGIGNAALEAKQNEFPQIQSLGSQGSFVGWDQMVNLYCKFTHIVDPDVYHFGAPLAEIKTLSALSGFTQCTNPHIEISGTETEANEVIGYMSNGFFLE